MHPVNRRVLATLLLTCAASPTGAGSLHGDISFGRSADATRARPRDAVVWLDSVPERVERKLSGQGWRWFWQARKRPHMPRVVQRRRQYDPRVIAIAAGTRLELRNRDQVWHGAFSVSPAHAFELGKRPPGSTDTLMFKRTGVIALRCDIHPDMSAFVVVTPNHAFTRPDAAGHWRLPDLPAGRYEVHAWHPELGESRREVSVPARGSASVTLRW